MNDIAAKASLSSLSVLLQSGALDAVEMAEATLARIRAFRDRSVFTCLTEERALAEAAASSARLKAGRSRGLLDGIPVAWKDLFDIEGIVTTAGSAVLAKQAPAARDANAVIALGAAGMVSVGRVNMSEFAFSGLGINPHYGTPANPVAKDTHRIPGGSSSGSGVAVAAGLVPVSIGSDTGGSVRIPAALNGIVGYKATRGRYSMAGVFPLAKSLDSLGVLCRTVADAVWTDAAMLGLTAPTVMRGDLDGLALVIPENVVFDGMEPEVLAAFEAALGRLDKAGVRISRRRIPAFDAIFELMGKHGPLVTAEAYVLHRARLAGPEAKAMDPRVVARAKLGEKIGMADYVETLVARERLIAEIAATVGKNALIAFPTVAHVAPPLAPLLDDDELFFATNAKTLRNTLIGNFLDWCGVSIPCGTGSAGMPVGLLLSGLPHCDGHLLSLALSAEPVIRNDLSPA
jgi:aspartyl-tRNA(Asn)/glutamyl-tRNA(Gln) amidotransferase subunit A